MPTDALQKIDRDLHRRAAKKLALGQPLRADEKSAYRRVEKLLEKESRDALLRELPIGEYCKLSGRQHKVVREQAERYGLPITERTVDVGAVLTAFHDILRDHGRNIGKQAAIDDPLLAGGSDDGEWLDRYRKEAALTKRLQREQMEGTLVPRAEIHEVLSRSAAMLRTLMESLEKKFGPDAADMAEAALDGLEREIESYFGGRDAA